MDSSGACVAQQRPPLEWVQGECPMGCGRTLFLGDGGHVTCSLFDCPDPAAADDLLRKAVEARRAVRHWRFAHAR